MDSPKDETKILKNDDENESFEPMDGSADTADGLDGENFEDAIEAPVEDKETNSENNEKVIEAITQQAFNKRTKMKEGDSEHFHSFDDANSELKLWNADDGVIIREIEEDKVDNPISESLSKLENEVVNSQEKFETVDSAYNDGLNHEPEQETLNGEEEAGTIEEINGRETDSIFGKAERTDDEVKSNEDVPPEKIIQEARDSSSVVVTENEVEACNGDRDILANEDIGVNGRNHMLADPIIVESDEASGETQSYDEVPQEEMVPEDRDTDPLAVTFDRTEKEEIHEEVSQKEMIQEAKDKNPITVMSDETQNGAVQTCEEVPQKEGVEELRDLGPIVVITDGTRSGDDQDSHDIKPMSNGTKCEDVQSSEDITQEARDALIGERHIQTYEDEPVNNDASDTNESFMDHANGPHENLVNKDLVQNNGAMNSVVNNRIEGEIREVEADNVSGSIVRGHFDEAPLVEDASDLSSSDNDENHTDTLPLATAPVPATEPALRKPAGSHAPPRPAGLGSGSLPDPSSTRSVQHVPNGRTVAPQRQSQPSDDAITDEVGEHDEIREKLQNIRVKFLRLVYRLGQTPHNTVVAQVLLPFLCLMIDLANKLPAVHCTSMEICFCIGMLSLVQHQLRLF
jgi:hypothetical protein